MPRSTAKPSESPPSGVGEQAPGHEPSRYTVALAPAVADNVARYARTADTSMSKAIAALVRLGLEGQESRKREFFGKLKANLANDDPSQQDQMVDEFRALILGREECRRFNGNGSQGRSGPPARSCKRTADLPGGPVRFGRVEGRRSRRSRRRLVQGFRDFQTLRHRQIPQHISAGGQAAHGKPL